MDIKLPCGGGMDLLFIPQPSAVEVSKTITLLNQRQRVALLLSRDGSLVARAAYGTEHIGWTTEGFLVLHDPVLRIVVLGHGEEPVAFLRLADAYGAEVLLLSPDAMRIGEVRRAGRDAGWPRSPGRSELVRADTHTAVVLLFHDHDREVDLLTQALRCERLLEAGVHPSAVARVIGPVGLLAGMRDPANLAVSILAQIVQQFQQLISPQRSAVLHHEHLAV